MEVRLLSKLCSISWKRIGLNSLLSIWASRMKMETQWWLQTKWTLTQWSRCMLARKLFGSILKENHLMWAKKRSHLKSSKALFLPQMNLNLRTKKKRDATNVAHLNMKSLGNAKTGKWDIMVITNDFQKWLKKRYQKRWKRKSIASCLALLIKCITVLKVASRKSYLTINWSMMEFFALAVVAFQSKESGMPAFNA